MTNPHPETGSLHAAYRCIAGGIPMVETTLSTSQDLSEDQFKRADKAVTVMKVGLKILKLVLRSRGIKKPKDA